MTEPNEHYTSDALPVMAADKLRVSALFDGAGQLTSLDVVINGDEVDIEALEAVVAVIHRRHQPATPLKPITSSPIPRPGIFMVTENDATYDVRSL